MRYVTLAVAALVGLAVILAAWPAWSDWVQSAPAQATPPLLTAPLAPTDTPTPLPRVAYLPLLPKDPTPTPTPTPSPSSTDIAVLSQRVFTYKPYGSTNYLVIVGELKNVSSQYRDPGTIQLIFYNASNGIVGVRNVSAYARCLAPGDKTTFRYETADIPSGWVRYDINILPTSTALRPLRLIISGVNSRVDSSGRLHFAGAVTNEDTESATAISPTVYVTFYDSNGTVLNAGSGPTYASLSPGMKAFFDVVIIGPAEYASYEVKAYAAALRPTPTPGPS